MLRTFGRVVSESGLLGLWKGVQPSVIRVGLGAGIHFVMLEQMKGLLISTAVDGSSRLSNINAALAGGESHLAGG